MTLEELHHKDVIQARTGANLGRADDLAFSPETGRIEGLILHGRPRLFGLLGRQDFPRLRVGVGSRPESWALADWVLSHYATEEERRTQFDAFLLAADTAMDLIRNGPESAMRTANAPRQ